MVRRHVVENFNRLSLQSPLLKFSSYIFFMLLHVHNGVKFYWLWYTVPYLFQFLSQRNLGSISYHKGLVPVPPPSFDNYLCRLDLQNSPEKLLISSIQADTKSLNETSLLQRDLKKEVTLYFSPGSKGYISLTRNIPPAPIINSYEKRMILMSQSTKEPAPEPPQSPDGKPTQAQIQRVFNVLSETVSIHTFTFRFISLIVISCW